MSLIQREGRPALDISPEKTPDTASWDEDYNDLGMNPLNYPVKEDRSKYPPNGWLTVASDIQSEAEGFHSGSGGEKR